MRVLSLLLRCTLFVACTPKSEEKADINKVEFDLVCEQFSALAKTPDFPRLNSEQSAEKLHQALTAQLNPEGNAFVAWSAIRMGPPDLRYTLFKEAAGSVGYAEWTCKAIELHGHVVGLPPS